LKGQNIASDLSGLLPTLSHIHFLKLKAQIVTLFILTSITIIGVTGYLYYYNARNVLIQENINDLKALSRAKAARVNSIVQNRIIEHEILRRSSQIRSELYKYIAADSNQHFHKIALYNNIIRSKEAIEGINRLMILDTAGNVIISSSPGKTEKENFSDYKSVIDYDKNTKVNIEYRYNEHEELVLCLAGRIDEMFVLLIENDVHNIISVTEEYTGMGKTGESALFYIDEEENIIYMTPLRFYNKAFLKEVKNTDLLTLQEGVRKGTVVYNNILDYRNKRVIAAVNNIQKTNWKFITKVDVSEALSYMDELRRMTIQATVIITFVMFVLIYLFAYFFVQPINELAQAAEEISHGNLSKRVEVKSKNELGQLAVSFNKMTNSLVAAQKDLQNKITELNRSNDALDKFAHVVSHDLKAPINSIEGLTNLLKLELRHKLSPEEMELVARIHEQTRKTKEMIKGILEFAELKAHKGAKEQVDLNEVVENLRATLDIPPHIKLLILERLPILNIERVLIYQVFQNLISNAVKYINKSEGYIRINCEEENNFYKFSFSDNGAGIDKEYQHKIFEMFNTGEADKGYTNTGIGLSIVKNIIEEKGGSIWVESVKGEGATFYFKLPVYIY
jgi:signal transduction histidine kinase